MAQAIVAFLDFFTIWYKSRALTSLCESGVCCWKPTPSSEDSAALGIAAEILLFWDVYPKQKIAANSPTLRPKKRGND